MGTGSPPTFMAARPHRLPRSRDGHAPRCVARSPTRGTGRHDPRAPRPGSRSGPHVPTGTHTRGDGAASRDADLPTEPRAHTDHASNGPSVDLSRPTRHGARKWPPYGVGRSRGDDGETYGRTTEPHPPKGMGLVLVSRTSSDSPTVGTMAPGNGPPTRPTRAENAGDTTGHAPDGTTGYGRHPEPHEHPRDDGPPRAARRRAWGRGIRARVHPHEPHTGRDHDSSPRSARRARTSPRSARRSQRRRIESGHSSPTGHDSGHVCGSFHHAAAHLVRMSAASRSVSGSNVPRSRGFTIHPRPIRDRRPTR